ncbi:indole-3-glycerol phosphate synthase TrpC [Gammaproteobacteria bacterium]|nr:indole-3-glycerol phosphate synthase TrpC [Gammaproteobacteria bacterium]MDA8815876.1 indole-3-glycerol phosphate synthase TrpC [Gammaproteobacteria bacterium]MDA9867564.1 indole-3-glycerol phosphate synthase TrpC [Gammaproteobacteria bacterium]MDC3225681.1 indole-3-glycerol phosphate synthase TrpC [Gammaproteobacteria bacterium]
MTILNDIVENTRAKLQAKKAELPLEDIISKLNELNLPKGAFKKSLLNKDQAIIAEIKKASPSAGIISEDFDPIRKAKEYEDFGASALSILTEEDFFQGSSQYLQDVKEITSLPILRKDFMIDEYQIYEAKLIGADCILLIASVLNDEEIKSFVDLAETLQLDYLIEVHDLEELKRVGHFSNAMIGVNNRNLKTFNVDLNISINLKKEFKNNNIFVAESGIKNQDDVNALKAHDIHVFLIGESLMKGDFA